MFKQAKTGLLHHKLITQHNHTARLISIHHLIVHENDGKQQALKPMFNLYGQMDGNLGVIKMNREHRYNMLTPSLIRDINRGVDTMNQDHIVHAIYLGTEKGEQWCNGTDFKSIAHMKKEDNFGRIQEYLQQIYNLQTNIASINKPLIAVAPGHAYNSGAAFLAATAHPMVTMNSRIAFNEVTFGFVPHSGGSYYMSRLKGEFGTFMALTGLSIHGPDAIKLDIARGVVNNPEEYSQEVADQVASMPYPEYGGNEIWLKQASDAFFMTPWQAYVRERQNILHQQYSGDISKLFRQQKNFDTRDVLLEPSERTPSSVAEANYRYMQVIRNDAEKNKPEDQSYLEYAKDSSERSSAFVYKNYFADSLGYITTRIGNPFPAENTIAVNHQQLIDRCFYSNSVEEIMDNLRKETHPFALECLNAMKRNSPTSMQLALKMLRKAANLDYKGCLQMELNVAFNRIQDADFDLGVKTIICSPKTKGESFKKAPEWQPLLKNSQLDRYFEESKYSKGVDLQVVENALLPTKNYYKRFTDQVRLWLNETSATQIKIRECFDIEARQALQEQGIDVRDLALTPEIARNHLRAKLAQERVLEVQEERSTQLMTDQKLRENYFKQIESEIDKLATNDAYFYSKVNKNVSEVFQDAYFDRLDNVFRKSQEAHNLEKRRMFIRFKKFIFKQRILSYGDSVDRSAKQLESLPFQQIHLTEKWDQSFRDGKHPDLVKSPLYYLSKVIGRVSLTAPELAKSYLTDPLNRHQMTLFTLNKSELEKLNADILSNPEKYEMILSGNTVEETDNITVYKRQRDLEDAKIDELEYWYRMLNDGRCPIDSLPYAQDFRAYKEWADLIESQALNTLRMCINKLLIDHESAETFNGSLKKLFSKVHNCEIQKPSITTKVFEPKMNVHKRPIDDIRKSIGMMLKNDAYLGHLFQTNQNDNARIANLKDEFELELLRLVEVVLLDKFGPADHATLKEMEVRLAELSRPKQLQSKDRSLNLIDQYLYKKNGEALVKDAFDLVAPYFVEMMKSRLQRETEDLLDEFNFDQIQGDVTVFYYMNQSFPNLKNNAVLQRYITYSFDQDMRNIALLPYPYLTNIFMRRELIAALGNQDLVASKSLQEQKFDSIQQTRDDLKQLERFDAEIAKQPNFKLATEQQKEKFLEFNEIEHRELHQLQTQMCDVYDFLIERKYELDHHMTDFDQLHIIAESVCKYDLDMSVMQKKVENKNWDSLAKYAQFVTQLAAGLEKIAENKNFDAITFMETQNTNQLQQQTFYAAVVAERERQRKLKEDEQLANRHNIIKSEITTFNAFQQKVKIEQEQAERLRELIESKPKSVQTNLNNFLSNFQFVNLTSMLDKVKKNDLEFLKKPEQVINIHKVIKVIKQSKQSLHQLSTPVDVVSLHQLKNQISQDTQLKPEQKANLTQIVNYVLDQTKYLSNQDRKHLTIKDYLEKHHFSSHAAYTQYSSDLLKQKIQAILGKTEPLPDVIEWQVGATRTLPSEHQAYQEGKNLTVQLTNENYIEEVFDKDRNFIQYNNPVTGVEEIDDEREYQNKLVYREARELSEIHQSMIPTKNFYEHQLLLLMVEPDFNDDEVNRLIEEYTQLRLQGCLLNKKFSEAIKKENAHIYLKVLREKVVNELGLNQTPEAYDLSYQNITDEFKNQQFFDIENAYNLQHLNNENAIGYDKLLERAQAKSAAENFSIAHETVFDKLLADYFLSKRGEYKEANKLVKDLSKIFEDKTAADLGFTGMAHLEQTNLRQNVNKETHPKLGPDSFREMIQLDVLTSRAMQHSKNGLSESLRSLSIKETSHPEYFKTQVPEYFELFDVRKPADAYVHDKLMMIIRECFDVRAQLEKKMTRHELNAFDKVLARYLQKEKLLPRLRHAVELDYNLLHQGRTAVNQVIDSPQNLETQNLKRANKQREYNKKIKDENAEFKLLAFNAVNDRKNHQLHLKNEDLEVMFNDESFEQYYKDQLKKDAQREPRKINIEDFKAKKPWEKPAPDAKYKNRKQREEDLWFDHSIYQEKKKEQQDRIQLFYILEQFYEQARQKPDSESRGQQLIKEYFADPEHTFFFDKNKLV